MFSVPSKDLELQKSEFLTLDWLHNPTKCAYFMYDHFDIVKTLGPVDNQLSGAFKSPKRSWIVLKLVKLTLGKAYFMKNNVWMKNDG